MNKLIGGSLRASAFTTAVAAACLACGPEGPGPNGEPANVPGTEVWIDAGDGLDHGVMTALQLSATEEMQVERTLTTDLSVEGVFEDGTVVDMTNRVEWSTSDDAILALTPMGETVQIEGLAEGTASVIAVIGELRAEQSVTVMPPALVGLSIATGADLMLKTATQLNATAEYRDGSTTDVTTQVGWSSSAPTDIAVLDDEGRKGVAYALSRNPATVTATFEDQTATADLAVACGLDPSNAINLNEVMPNASWEKAFVYDADGTRTVRALSVQDLMCDSAFDGFKAFAFSINAGWCGPCHAWMRTAAAGESELLAEGIMPIFVVGQTTERSQAGYDAATSDYAESLASTHAQDAMSIRVGDADTMGAGPGIKQVLNQTQAWPSLFVVDRADMRVLSLAAGAPRSVAGLIQIASAAGGAGGGGMPAESNCSMGADEASEPNDIAAIAPSIGVGQQSGGICNDEPDFFRVKVDGPWRATIMFENATADLDLFAWDETTGAVLQVNGQAVASASTRRGFESIELSGEAVIRVQAKAKGTADYSLFIEPR